MGLSRKTSRVIKQNLWMSLGMVAFLIPATILGLRIGPAVALHEGSTLVVIFNALCLLAYRPPKISEQAACQLFGTRFDKPSNTSHHSFAPSLVSPLPERGDVALGMEADDAARFLARELVL